MTSFTAGYRSFRPLFQNIEKGMHHIQTVFEGLIVVIITFINKSAF